MQKNGRTVDMKDETRLSATLLNIHLNLKEIAGAIGQLLREFPSRIHSLDEFPQEQYVKAKRQACLYGSVARPPTKEDFKRDEVVGSEEVGGGGQEEGRSFGA